MGNQQVPVDTEKAVDAQVDLNDEKLARDLDNYVYVPGTPEEKALIRKIDLHMFPMLWVMFCLNYLDRTNIGNAKVGGMEQDLKLTSSEYSLTLSIFFVGYLLWEVPSNMIIARSKPGPFLALVMFVWGAISIAVKGVNNLGGIVAFRFFLGIVEAGFFPGLALLISCWYRPDETAKRIALLYTSTLVSGAFGGLLAGGIIDGMEGLAGTRGWKWLFIIEGLATCVVAAASYFVLPNYPLDTKWLTDDERRLAIARLRPDPTDISDDQTMTAWEGFKESIKDPKTWCFLVLYNMFASVGTISYFFPTLCASLGYKGPEVQFMTVPIYAVAFVVCITGGYIADRYKQKFFVIAACATLGVVSFIICATVSNPKVKYAFICFGCGAIWTNIPLFISWAITMFDGREKRAVSIGLVNGFGNLSSVYGSFFWPSNTAPGYGMGFAITTAFMAAAAIGAGFCKWKYGDRGVDKTS